MITAVPILIGLVLAYAQMTPPALWGIGVLLIVLLMLNLGRRLVRLFRLAVSRTLASRHRQGLAGDDGAAPQPDHGGRK